MSPHEEMTAPEFHMVTAADVARNDGWAPESEPTGKRLQQAIAPETEEAL